MKECEYFSIYDEFFKDAKNFLNTITETNDNGPDSSSSGETSVDDKDGNCILKKGKKEKFLDFHLDIENNKVVWHEGIINDNINDGSCRGSSRGSSRGSGRGSSRGSGRGSNRGSGRGSNRGSGRGSSRGSGRGSGNGSSNGSCTNVTDSELNKNGFNPMYPSLNREAPKILLCYGKSHNMCLSYKLYYDNINQESTNVNYSLSIFRKKFSTYDYKAKEYNLEKKNENKIKSFLFRLAFWKRRAREEDLLFMDDGKKQIKYDGNNITYEHTEARMRKDKYYNADRSSNEVVIDHHHNRHLHYEHHRPHYHDRGNNHGNKKKVKDGLDEEKKRLTFNEEKDKEKVKEKEKEKERIKKKGVSYEYLLTPSKHEYDAFCLFNPRFKQGKHHTVMFLQSYNVSIIPFVKPKKLKEEVNELFNEINPWIDKSLTLSKLRNLKIDIFNLINSIPEIDISTISCAWVFFERLVIKGYVHKCNRKLYAATCLILSLKFYQHDDIQILEKLLIYIQKLDKKENLTPSLIFSVEFLVYRLLDFSLQHTYENIRAHIHQYLESKELKFEDVYGISEDVYICSNYCKES
ncbi:cyclin dependent kinase binding protein [Plasmodium brasilianum]|uniref:Cyclin dependent kinase binding protein n=1 Tax=Plasmodium brasilianum TaxID=5824 RepID=A0ACB9Y7D9_PLABR|nr:cyclin dependent kinase binding protein [Plasmodium brasilianum]